MSTLFCIQSGSVEHIMKKHAQRTISVLFCFLLIAVLLESEAYGSALSDPGVPDGEQIVWRITRKDKTTAFSIITWNVIDRDGKPVYEVTEDSGERKQAKYIIDKSDLRLIWGSIRRNTEKGMSEATIEVRGERQYLIHDLNGERGDKEIECPPNGYNGIILPFSLRGFPFGEQKEIKLKITPPFKPTVPLWVWKMWKSYVRFLGEEKVTVPAGTFDCYKLEMGPSGGLIKRLASQYYLWLTKEPPHRFVKFQEKDGERVTELMEIRHMGEE